MSGSRTWRDADLRGDGPVPTSVGSVVRRTCLGLRAVRGAETVLFCGAGICITLGAAALSGVEIGSFDAWTVALFGGSFLAASWWLEYRTDVGRVARTLDRRLRHQGALVTAFEIEREPARSPMADLVVQRVLARLRTREAVRTLLPPLAVPVAVPLVGLATLAICIELASPAEDATDVDLARLSAGMVNELADVTAHAMNATDRGTVDDETVQSLLGLQAKIRSFGLGLERFDEDPDKALDELAAFDRELSDLAPRVAAEPELAEALESARSWIDAARMALAGPEGAQGRDAASEGEPGLADGGADGTMSGSSGGGMPASGAPGPLEGTGGPDTPSGAASAAAASGEAAGEFATRAGDWWPAEYDAIVRGWVESRRRTLETPSSDPKTQR